MRRYAVKRLGAVVPERKSELGRHRKKNWTRRQNLSNIPGCAPNTSVELLRPLKPDSSVHVRPPGGPSGDSRGVWAASAHRDTLSQLSSSLGRLAFGKAESPG